MKIGIIGSGKIGKTIYQFLEPHYDVKIGDIREDNIVVKLDATNVDSISAFLQGQNICITATPFQYNRLIAEICAMNTIAYFDLTEDVETTNYIKQLAKRFKNSFLMPQCGLAPGIISIIGHSLTKNFDQIKSLKLRTGALPTYPTNRMKYSLTWSTEGLVNQYIQECDAIVNGQQVKTAPLSDLESVLIEGTEFEIFNTSGGLGTLTETFRDRIEELNYKSIRYPDHCSYMKFLLDDLNYRTNPKELIRLLNANIPSTKQDLVVMYATAVGTKNGNLVSESYSKKIFHDNSLSAIQIATANGICAAVDLYIRGKLSSKKGFVRQEDIDLGDLFNTPYGKVFT